jgi:hypothetical protein
VNGGCSCDFLARGAHDYDDGWQFDPGQVPKLSAAIQALNSEVKKYRFLAHWIGGDTPRSEVRITGKELLRLVNATAIQDNVVYRTWAGDGR